MITEPVRYVSDEEDSGRWTGFPFRDRDIVISTRSKSGTTWVQMICALLVFQKPDLPAPLAELSPWLDWSIKPVEEVVAGLEAQQHRRFVKTHTPLDGLPLDPRATYIVCARDPRDMYVSLRHQSDNIDRAAMRRLLGTPDPRSSGQAEPDPRPALTAADVRAALLRWIESDASPQEQMDSIRGVFHHVDDTWARRHSAEADVVLVHYSDLLDDLEGQMRVLADRLGISVPEQTWPALVEAATFAAMRPRARQLAPGGASSVLKDPDAFFRRGRSGAWRELLTDDDVARYERRVADLAPPDVRAWLHR